MSLRAVGGPARPGIVPQAGLLVGGQVLAGVVAFATTPIIALGLGAEQYGLYTLLFLFLGYATALDLGLSYSLIKHIAEHDPERERAEIESLVNNAAAVYATVAVLSVVVLALGRGWMAHALLRLPERLVPTAETATLLIACSLPFTAALTMFGAVFRGLLRFDYVALFGLLNGALYGVGAAILVAFGGRLRAVVGLYAGLMTASALVQWVVLRRLVPGIRIVPRLEGKTLRQLFGFGGFMLFNHVGQIALQQLDRLVISRVLSVAMTGYYAVPFNIGQRVGTLGAAAATVALPHSSGSVARGELGEFRRAYASSARFVAWLTLAPALVVIVFGDKLLTYWMSPEFAAHGTVALRLLAFGAFWMGVASLSAVSIEGAGRPWVTSAFTALTGGLNLAGLLLLTPRWGLGGAAASVTGSVLVLAALDVWYFSTRVVRTAMGEWVGSVVVPVFATTVLSLPLLLPLRAVMSTLSSVILVAGLAMGAVGVIGYRLFLSADERRRTRAQAAALWRRWTAPDATLPEEV